MESIEGQCVQITLNYHADIPPTNKTATPVFNGILLENVQVRVNNNWGILLKVHIAQIEAENLSVS